MMNLIKSFNETQKKFKDEEEKNSILYQDYKASLNNTEVFDLDFSKSNYSSNETRDISIEVVNNSTIDEIIKQTANCKNIIALNFASATKPGGGVKTGSTAQEESLCRASGLYNSLITQRTYYRFNNLNYTPIYNNKIIFTPNMPIIKDNDGNWLDEYKVASFVTSPAVNCSKTKRFFISKEKAYNVMDKRIELLLDFMLSQNPDCLVLGAFGCGVFRNNPEDIAKIFKKHLSSRSKYIAEHNIKIVFAIYDRKNININIFNKELKDYK